MNQHIAHIALVVNNYDEAIKFYTEKLNFILLEDTKLSETKRWVMVKPPGEGQCSCSWHKPPQRSKKAGWATKPVAGCSCSYTPMISGVTIIICWRRR